MKALWHIDNSNSILQEVSQTPITNFVSIKSAYSMISTGTERLIACGLVNKEFESNMSVPYMDGGFDFPIKYGYSLVGFLENGNLVHMMHPHQDVINVKKEDTYSLSRYLPAHRATLISNMETVINAIWDSEPKTDQKIAICGFGNIGCLIANTLRVHYQIETDIIEIDPWRCKKSEQLGWKVSPEDSIYDIIYHTTATEGGLQQCLEKLNEEGKLIELSWYGTKKVNLSLGRDFHYKRLSIISSQVSVIPQKMRTTQDYISRKNLAAQYLQNESYDKLITNIISFKDAPNFFNSLRIGNQEKGLIYLLEY